MLGHIDGVVGTGMLSFIRIGAVADTGARVGGCGGNEAGCEVLPPPAEGGGKGTPPQP